MRLGVNYIFVYSQNHEFRLNDNPMAGDSFTIYAMCDHDALFPLPITFLAKWQSFRYFMQNNTNSIIIHD